jgi:hypothetical protein
MRRRISRLLVASALLSMVPTGASADISIRLSNQELTSLSEVILVGRATSTQSRWIDRTLVTAVDVQITQTLKGPVDGSVEVLLPGGVDAARRIPVAMTYAGAPMMRPGEDVFLFLVYDADVRGYIVTGFAQGKLSIMTDAAGVRRVHRDLRGSQLVEGAGVARGTVTMATLSAFTEEILGYLAQ